MLHRMIHALAVLCVASQVQAAPADRVVVAFESWLETHNTTGAVALVHKGEVVVAHGAGKDPSAAVELASLSKAITGVCAAQLVALGKMDWADGLHARTGRGPNATLAELLTQSAGITPDSTQDLMGKTFDQNGPHQSAAVLDAVADRVSDEAARGRHLYNNENYALVALMIEAATGEAYEDACRQAAIMPSGQDANPSPRAGAFLPWGGWQMSVSDYALWHHYWFSARHDPAALPDARVQGGVRYGIGTYFRQLPRGNTAWHFGALCFDGRMTVGSYVVTLFDEWTLMAAYDTCVSFDAMFALDQALVGALFAAE